MSGKVTKLMAVLLLVVLTINVVGCSTTDANNGDQVVMGGDRTIASGETVEGDLSVFGGSVVVEDDATIQGDLSVFGGDVTLNGAVEGDVVTFGGSVEKGPNAVVAGDSSTFGGSIGHLAADARQGVIPKEPNAPVAPEEPGVPVPPVPPVAPEMPAFQAPETPSFFGRVIDGVFSVFGKIMQAIAFGAIGLVLTLFLPDHVRRVGIAAEKAPVASMGVGFLVSMVLGVALFIAVLASFLLIGIPFVLLISLGGAAASILGYIGIGYFFGTRLLKGADIRAPRPAAAAAIGTGTLVLASSFAGFIPFLGWIVAPIIGLWGLGATVLTRGGTQTYPGTFMGYTPNTPIGKTRTASTSSRTTSAPASAATETPVTPRTSSASGNLFADLANDLGLDEDDLRDTK